jgi:hypothetical protein
MACSIGCLNQHAAQPAVPLAGSATALLACALVLARTDSYRRGKVPRAGEASHVVNAELGDENLRDALPDPRNGVQVLNGFLERSLAFGDLLAQRLDPLLLQKIDMARISATMKR